MIGDQIEIKIVQVRGSGDQAMVRLGIIAPKNVTVLRKEVYLEVASENRRAVAAGPIKGLEDLGRLTVKDP
jgi:carbon storage regulator